jgi:hypothetical protein
VHWHFTLKMPELHEFSEEWVYTAICDGKFKFDPVLQVYKYDNIEKFPNKKYKKTFDPKSFMVRGDVIHFGNDDYRNNNKLIFDGIKLQELYTKVDDYGSVTPDFVCGDSPNEFNIGDFEDIIDHNTINWLSKQKLKEIVLSIKNDEIYGKVVIKGKKWTISINIHEDDTFSKGIGFWGNRPFKCEVDNNIKIYKKSTYLIEAEKEEDTNNLKMQVEQNNEVNIIHYYSNYGHSWFLFHIKNETKYKDMTTTTPNFPIIWRKVTKNYTSECIVFNQENYDNSMKSTSNMEEIDNTYICEVTGYTVNITIAPISINDKLNCVKHHINELIKNYDDITKRHPFLHEDTNLLEMYM